jgi:pantoate--beta-alanine ligase
MLESEGCALLWAPDVATIYPAGHATRVRVAGVSEPLEGAARPGHFDGVATVVAKLFNQVRPDLAFFGEKDFQQLAVIRAMARDLDMNVTIIGVPTQRDADGLALSSRNAYLSHAERLCRPRAAAGAGRGGPGDPGRGGRAIRAASRPRQLEQAGFSPIDYLALSDPETLELLARLDRPARLLAAARLGSTRLSTTLRWRRSPDPRRGSGQSAVNHSFAKHLQ